ncbi:MAG: DUF72 domain-containing protein [Gemmatimonadota bacterium]
MGQILLGTQGWNYDSWVGPFYPKVTRQADYLKVYARAFGTVEVDSTFYAIPPARTVEHWAQRVPDGFIFACKMPQEITHERRLENVADVLAAFTARLRLLGPKLGPVLIQFGPDFGPRRRAALEQFLPRLPRDIRFAVEFRRNGWVVPSVLRLLADHGVALALVDGRWLPRESVLALAETPTADFAYVRWMGPDRKIEDFSRVVVDRDQELGEWAPRLVQLAARVSTVYGYFNNHFQGHSPASARAMQKLLDQHVVSPSELADQVELF